MDYSRIPEELKNLKQWVCAWDTSKIPMKSFERKAASSTAPETWGTFEQAQAAVEGGMYDHIGFVFADNGIVGIDIDSPVRRHYESLWLIHGEIPQWPWCSYPATGQPPIHWQKQPCWGRDL